MHRRGLLWWSLAALLYFPWPVSSNESRLPFILIFSPSSFSRDPGARYEGPNLKSSPTLAPSEHKQPAEVGGQRRWPPPNVSLTTFLQQRLFQPRGSVLPAVANSHLLRQRESQGALGIMDDRMRSDKGKKKEKTSEVQ